MDITQIAQAWANAFTKPASMNDLAEARKQTCNDCEHKTKEFGIEVCAVCHCPLYAKIYTPADSCPKNKWSA